MALDDLLNRDGLAEDVREAIREELAVRKRAEEARRESEERFRTFLDSAAELPQVVAHRQEIEI